MKNIKKFYASLSEDNKLIIRAILSFIRTIIAFEMIELTFVLTDSHAIFDFFSQFDIASYITFFIYMISSILGSIVGFIGLFSISPLGWLILVGLFRQACGISYRPVQKTFHKLKKIFLW